MTRRLGVAATPGARSRARTTPAEACAADLLAHGVVVLAGLASLPEHLRVDRAEHRSVRVVRHCDLDFHEARDMDDDPVERLVFADERDELAFVKGLHLVEPTGGRAGGPGRAGW